MAILIDKNTRMLIQGITGREAVNFTRDSLEYGAKIVAGVTPGRGGYYVHGVPVFDTVESALQAEECDLTIISVPPPFALDAAYEALDHGLRLLNILTERIPVQDTLKILERAAKREALVIGPNSLGLITPGQTRAGICGGAVVNARESYSPGPVGIISRSGGMLTEIASLLTQHKIGQSTCISIGGDRLVGTTFLDLLPHYEADTDTRALVLFCEPGGSMEEQLAGYLAVHRSRLLIVALIAGRFTDKMKGMRFGHAGVIVEGNKGSPLRKIEALKSAGVKVCDSISDIPSILQQAL